jgi:uncharacterized membrane protein YgaE (UPF0421/DUF939 family)
MSDKDKYMMVGNFNAYLVAALITYLFNPGPTFFFIMAMVILLAMSICAMNEN